MSDQTPPMPPAQPHPPAGPPGPPPSGGWQGPGQPPGEPGGRRPGLWRQATSTTGGKIATGVALGLTGLMLLGVMAVGLFAIARVADFGDERRERVAQRGDEGFGERGRGMGPRMGQGGGSDLRDGQGIGGGLLGRLGNVQHGELTVTGSDGKAVVMTVQRGAVTAASATSVSVRSADGFSQTYAVNTATRVTGGSAAALEKGDQVLVLARKDDRVAVQVRALNR